MNIHRLCLFLNNQQRAAVSAPRTNFLVLAGAGSGKTRVLVHRIAWLIEVEKCSPQSILAVTFTTKAAEEIRERLEELIGLLQNSMWIGTFHSLSHRFLCSHHIMANLPKDFQIIDTEDQMRLLRRLIQSMNLDLKQWTPRQGLWYINTNKEKGLRPNHIHRVSYPIEKTWLRIYRAYQDTCDRLGLVDFSELLLRVYELWRSHPAILDYYHRIFNTILVDEFQDTNNMQYDWMRSISGKSSHVMIVGDDDQSIYGWRGAKISNMQSFLKDFPLATVIRLERNYRSTSNILEAANILISNNNGRLGKKLWTNLACGELITTYCARDAFDEACFVADGIQVWVQNGGLLSECAVLYRNNAQSLEIEKVLSQRGIVYQVYGGMRFFQRQEIKDAIAYLRLIANRNDDLSFERIINTPTRGIGIRTLEVIRQLSREYDLPFWEASKKLLKDKALASRLASTSLQSFMELVDSLEEVTHTMPLYAQIERMLKDSGLWLMYLHKNGENGQRRIENLKELINTTRQYDSHHALYDKHEVPLRAFLAQSMLEAGGGSVHKSQDSVRLMTMHSSKGLEFAQVFIIGMEEGIFPGQISLNDAGGLEEERRLAYVGITRAMVKLTLTYAINRRLYGQECLHEPSRFIGEIPSKYIKNVHYSARATTNIPYHYKGTNTVSMVSNNDVRIIQRVQHEIFGLGTVMDTIGCGKKRRIQVNFDDYGVKWLLASYAKLKLS
ncbi:DNA helicase II [Candidatus Erwinia haradaeae]|uniref:DNA 3'-5' helicase n=1 Tax=Candidatus Erwinia haradaeae TaxID=1922217 RepID=A0A451DC54_9GAMM|nr:DNA helicase II [Candidatus Erwinia haradaeae]VFP83996.1 DNA helicase II [Candidatus Erwinia haradaeae]